MREVSLLGRRKYVWNVYCVTANQIQEPADKNQQTVNCHSGEKLIFNFISFSLKTRLMFSQRMFVIILPFGLRTVGKSKL